MKQEYTTEVMQYGPGGQPWESGPRQDMSDIGPVGVIGMILALALVIAWGLFWLWMLIDLLKRKTMDGTTKLVWLVVLIFINFLGVLLYYFIIYRPERKSMVAAAAPQPASNPVSGVQG